MLGIVRAPELARPGLAWLAALDLAAKKVRDVDNGFTCVDPLCVPLAEPAGVHHDGEMRLLVSDTNNHRLVIYDRDARTTKTFA